MRSLPVIVLVALSLSACRKHVAENPPSVIDAPVASTRAPPPAIQDEIRRNFERVNFAFDSSSLDGPSRAALARNAEIMTAYPSLRVEVQGHCDERGTTNYNMALGQRRAASVTSFLSSQGVASSRLVAISYGEERPLSRGDSESIWAQNRRAEFRLLSQTEGVVGTTN